MRNRVSISNMQTDVDFQSSAVTTNAALAARQNSLARTITRAGSQQTFNVIRWLVDRERVEHAFQAYAYFRWVDDHLDEGLSLQSQRVAFVKRQQRLVDDLYAGKTIFDLSSEEQLLSALIRSDDSTHPGLHSYIRNLMKVMVFDAERRGRFISKDELVSYSLNLATAVTDGLHYFIGHEKDVPIGPARYQAVIGAHIAHMLRDTFDDVAAGYYNVPREQLQQHNIAPIDIESVAYRQWVQQRVQLARHCFSEGKTYLQQVESLRCRIAGFSYMARFEHLLDIIQRDGYRLRPTYDAGKRLIGGVKMARSVLMMTLHSLW